MIPRLAEVGILQHASDLSYERGLRYYKPAMSYQSSSEAMRPLVSPLNQVQGRVKLPDREAETLEMKKGSRKCLWH